MSEALSDILIFGAGFGTRMAPLTDTAPKPLIPVAGQALVDHAIALATEAELQVHVNAHYLADQMEQHLNGRARVHVEHPDILDTGGGLKAALPKMTGDPVATLNSDAVWKGPNPMTLLRQAWRPEMDALLLLIPIEQTVGYHRSGNFARDDDGNLRRSQSGEVYTGAQLIRKDPVLDHHDAVFSLNKIWDQLLGKGTLFGVSYPGQWADVGTPAGISEAEAMLGQTHV
ncbi:MAG: nucleotidyltransferase family protein [Pseudomonadota bacterium]